MSQTACELKTAAHRGSHSRRKAEINDKTAAGSCWSASAVMPGLPPRPAAPTKTSRGAAIDYDRSLFRSELAQTAAGKRAPRSGAPSTSTRRLTRERF
ncbi:hypothetical protein SKAU_G00350570 [Synaphobranchus kaupii]|uniref:Uncharacterized protein n=1 Tax=Synaphobranchus kaupii TaxID=118154 RepID=A0A9Q1II60_SYNKA|nr:hypothetical protein SKAU_G00350570 [Synaphobranchus kaupii]